MECVVRSVIVGLAALGVAGPPAAAQSTTPLPPGWIGHPLADGASFVEVFEPPNVAANEPPAIVFLHGAGSEPRVYRSRAAAAAQAAGVVLALPKSRANEGWGFAGDSQLLVETVRTLLRIYGVAPDRIALAGHSAGGAYAYLQAYLGEGGWSGVFSLAAPFQPVVSLRAGEYRAPIRMFYSEEDWNYQNGSAARLVAQWQRLGIQHDLVTLPGYGHNAWPSWVLDDGFRFLAAQHTPDDESFGARLCVPSATRLCLHEDRFGVEVTFRDFAGNSGSARPLPIPSDDSGLFWFFRAENWELLVKVLDGCAANGHWWVFAAGTTDVEFELRVSDTYTGRVVSYHNARGQRARAITDTRALSTCP